MYGFTYNGYHSSEFNCWYVPNETVRWFPSPEFSVEEMSNIPYHAGGYYYGADTKPREFVLDCYFEDITRENRERLRAWLDRRTSGEQIFDDRKFVHYNVRPTKPVTGKSYTHRIEGDSEDTYSGTFTITFTAYEPYGYLEYKEQTDEQLDEHQEKQESGLNIPVDDAQNMSLKKAYGASAQDAEPTPDNPQEIHSVEEINIVVHDADDVTVMERTITPPRPLNKIGAYADMLDVIGGVWKYALGAEEFDGTENWDVSVSSLGAYTFTRYDPTRFGVYADVFVGISNRYHYAGSGWSVSSVAPSDRGTYLSSRQIRILWASMGISTAAEMKDLLASWAAADVPLRVVAAYAEEQTESVNAADLAFLRSLHLLPIDHHIVMTDQDGNDISYLLNYGLSFDKDNDASDNSGVIPAYMMPHPVTVSDGGWIYNPGTKKANAVIEISGSAPNGITITNTTNGTSCILTGLPTTGTLRINGNNGLVELVTTESIIPAYSYHDEGFVVLEPYQTIIGKTNIILTAGSNVASVNNSLHGINVAGKYVYIDDKWNKITSNTNTTITLETAPMTSGNISADIITMNEISVTASASNIGTFIIDYDPMID